MGVEKESSSPCKVPRKIRATLGASPCGDVRSHPSPSLCSDPHWVRRVWVTSATIKIFDDCSFWPPTTAGALAARSREELPNIWQVTGIEGLWPWAMHGPDAVHLVPQEEQEVWDVCFEEKVKTKTDKSTRLRNEWKSPKMTRLFNVRRKWSCYSPPNAFKDRKVSIYLFFHLWSFNCES